MEINFRNKENIGGLRDVIRKALGKYIDNDYVLLDVPNHRNIGDLLIWQGELEFLKETKYKSKYSSNVYTHQDKKISDKDIIMLHGGGNFGDVWRMNQLYRNDIIKKFPNNRIIIFPQTIHYENEENLLEDAEIHNNHPNLVLCARDKVSYDIAIKYFNKCNVYLLPDMAFFLDLEEFHSKLTTGKTLIMKRVDKELGDIRLIHDVEQKLNKRKQAYDIKDWPGFLEEGTLKRRIQGYLHKAEIRLSKRIVQMPLLSGFINDQHGLKSSNYKTKLITTGIEFTNEYDTVYSTRLHGFILAVLLNKEVYIFDNSYGKNKNFFETWLENFENVKLIEE